MIAEFRKFISDNNIVKQGDKILLAVSGGIDSMVMTHLFYHLNHTIGIAHCNFGLRYEESDKDEEIVREFAERNSLPFYTKHFQTKNYAKVNRLSIQMAARDLRYKWFEEIRSDHGYESIAVAHNLNDNIETLLINLLRGTGLAGLSGMKPVSNKIIRPLLFATRDEIIMFRNEHNIAFREDRSNADTKYIRNKIRHRIIPLLKEINPSFEKTLNDTAERFSEINDIVSSYISNLSKSISDEKEDLVKIDIALLGKYLHNKTILYELFKPYGITNVLLSDLINVITGKTGGRIFTGTHRIIKNRKEIIVTGAENNDETEYIIENVQSFNKFPGFSSAKYINISEMFELATDPHTACIDSQKVSFPVIIRKWKAGDYFYPLGMKQKKKLSDYFIDNKYSRFDKDNIFILVSDGKIAWIIGDRIDDRFKITDETKEGILIKSKRKSLIKKPVK